MYNFLNFMSNVYWSSVALNHRRYEDFGNFVNPAGSAIFIILVSISFISFSSLYLENIIYASMNDCCIIGTFLDSVIYLDLVLRDDYVALFSGQGRLCDKLSHHGCVD